MKCIALQPVLNRGSVGDKTVFGIKIFIHVVEHEDSLHSFRVLSGIILPTFSRIKLMIEALG